MVNNPDNADVLTALANMQRASARFINGHLAKIAIIGTGAFGSALAFVALQGGCQVTMFSYEDAKRSEFLENPVLRQAEYEFLSSSTRDLVEFDLIVLAVASQALRQVAGWITRQVEKSAAKPSDKDPLYIVCAAKGIELNTLKLPSQVLGECLPPHCVLGTLSGPSFAKELMQGLPSAVVIASENKNLRARVISLLHRACFRVYDCTDPIGIEVSGALKNVIAIVSGGCDGLGLGNNARAAVVTRGFSEIVKIGMQLGAQSITFLGLGGLGDLFLTAAGDLSRNRQLGVRLAQGETKETIMQSTGEVIEGIATAESAFFLAKKYKLDTPVIQIAYGVLYENLAVKEAILALVTRHHKGEFDGIDK